MTKTRAWLAITLASLLSLPYLFYALIFRGLFAYAWVLLSLVLFVIWLSRRPTGDRWRTMLPCALASIAVALPSLSLGAIWLTAGLLASGLLVFGLFSLGVRGLQGPIA